MTLTLDEVRKVQFHESRRRGYEVTDVDLFVDRVEASFEQLIEENDALKQEIEALKKATSNGSSAPTQAASAPKAEASPMSVTDDTAEQPAIRPGGEDASSQAKQGAEQKTEKIVVSTSAEASPAVIRLVQMATDQAETLVNEAETQAAQTRQQADSDAQSVLEDAKRKAREIGADASTRAERLESEARVGADKVRGDAQNKADSLNADLEKRRVEMFTDLDRERESLVSAVAQLREFEQTYRSNLSQHLQGQLEAVRDGRFEPETVPALANSEQTRSGARKNRGDSQDSATPRLDALLGDRAEA